jgi:hypothetical protein
MSQPNSLSSFVGERFRAAFGNPHKTMGKDDHWRLQSSPAKPPVNLLLNGTRDAPALWIFDAEDGGDGVFCTSITHQDQIAGIIVQIQQRVNRAAVADQDAS